MAMRPPQHAERPTSAIEEHALDDLRYIRRTMEGAGAFTTASGIGQTVIGLTALAAAWNAARQPDGRGWLTVWLAESALALAIAVAAMFAKARRAGMPLASEPARRFTANFALPMLAGLALSLALVRAGNLHPLPGVWLLMFGTAVAAGGAFSVAPVRHMGHAFMLLGVAALFAPAGWGDALLALGFGGLLIGFGVVIAWRHGG